VQVATVLFVIPSESMEGGRGRGLYNFLDGLANSLSCQLVNQIHFVHNTSSGILLVVNLLQHLMTIGAFQETLVQVLKLRL
jgi:hypothetical protein